ncbi:MAG TPA: serine/threonine-protein kinase, partial [Planctomycetota bacterium]|nr:serine/threonine-protein kinase [Planctomycetota bacterium]
MSGPPAEPQPSQQRWAQVRALLERTLDVASDEREAFVAREAGSDAALRAEVEALLASEDGVALEAPEGWPRRVEPEAAPQRAGPWRLLRRIGAGGMGEVFLGVRADGQFKRRVAVKLIKLGMDTEEVLRRFEREREVLAALDHPGIARLLDGGVGSDGRPYLVLEFVEGEPLDRWCDHQRLSVRERVELFAEVCDAVEVAHRSQVVHRDLKPGNVLVDAEGRPKLLDFGIAKVLSGDRGPATVDLTDTPLRLLTPSYASPEQVRGGSVTPASDVYSLGAMLYELLSGRRALELQALSPLEIERTVCEREPVRPSQALTEEAAADDIAARRGTSPRGLRRELEGDLDTIVLEALRKEPRRRYPSAAELAADLRRHLDGRPVRARPDTLRYRASKFVRRNALAVGSTALVLAALVVGLSVSLWQYRRASAANARLATQSELDRRRSRELEDLSEDLRRQTELAKSARAEAELQTERAERRYRDLRDIAREGIFE